MKALNCRFFLLVTLVLTSGFAVVAAQPNPAPPYLYYYSRLYGGLIVERADGTDSRLIGSDAIPPGMSGIGGAGWSPSGRYFAAYPVNYSSYGGSTGSPFIMTAIGEQRAYWLTNVVSTFRMEWSPGEKDLLLVGGTFNNRGVSYLGIFIWLIDPTADRLLAEFGASQGMAAYGMSSMIWETAAEQVSFYGRADLATGFEYYRVTMHFDGTVVKEPVTEAEYSLYAPDDIYASDGNIDRAYGLSPSGRYEAAGKFPTILRDLQSNLEVELPTHSQGTICRGYHWNTDENYLITMDGTLVAGGGCYAPVLGVTDSQGELWRELGGCSWDVPPCVGWLPPHVDLSTLPPGQHEPVQLDPVSYDASDTVFGPFQSPAAPDIRFKCEETGNRVYDATNQDEASYQLDNSIDCPYHPDSAIAETGTRIVFADNSQYGLLAMYERYGEPGVSIWKVCDEVGHLIKWLNTYGYELAFTPDGEQLRARNVNAWKIYSVADILRTAEADCPETAVQS